MNKDITIIEDLARMINEGFKTTATTEDINRVEIRLDGIEPRLGRIKSWSWKNRSEKSRIWRHG
jgi:transposase